MAAASIAVFIDALTIFIVIFYLIDSRRYKNKVYLNANKTWRIFLDSNIFHRLFDNVSIQLAIRVIEIHLLAERMSVQNGMVLSKVEAVKEIR